MRHLEPQQLQSWRLGCLPGNGADLSAFAAFATSGASISTVCPIAPLPATTATRTSFNSTSAATKPFTATAVAVLAINVRTMAPTVQWQLSPQDRD